MTTNLHESVYAAISAAILDVGGVAKSRKNAAQGFQYRGIADVTLACQPILGKHGLAVVPHDVLKEEWFEHATKNGGVMYHVRQRIEFRCYHSSGTHIPVVVTGEAMDTGDKTANKAMSVALKYALCQLLCIPEEDPEVDTDASSPGEALEHSRALITKEARTELVEMIKELGWAVPHTINWLKKHYGVDKTDRLTAAQGVHAAGALAEAVAMKNAAISVFPGAKAVDGDK